MEKLNFWLVNVFQLTVESGVGEGGEVGGVDEGDAEGELFCDFIRKEAKTVVMVRIINIIIINKMRNREGFGDEGSKGGVGVIVISGGAVFILR